jgi:hypothetical protein
MKTKKRKGEASLTEAQIATLIHTICHSQGQEEEEARAQALLLLVDELEREATTDTTIYIKRTAFSMCCEETMAAHIQLTRTEI